MKNKNFSLVFFTTRGLFLGFVFSLMFNTSENDSIIAALIGSLLGAIIICIFHKLKRNNPFSKAIEVIICLFFLTSIIMILSTFINSFLLFKTPKILIIAPTIVLCTYAALKGKETITNTSNILIFISITTLLLISISLTKYISIQNVLPLGVHKPQNILLSSFYFAILSAAPNILVISDDLPLKKHLKYYLFTVFVNSIICFIILSSLTPKVAKLYSFPEYMVLKRIKIFEFIENVENFASTVCYLDIFVFVTLTIKRILDICEIKKLGHTLIWLTSIIVTILINHNYYYILYVYHNASYILAVLLALLIIFSIKKEKSISNEKHR